MTTLKKTKDKGKGSYQAIPEREKPPRRQVTMVDVNHKYLYMNPFIFHVKSSRHALSKPYPGNIPREADIQSEIYIASPVPSTPSTPLPSHMLTFTPYFLPQSFFKHPFLAVYHSSIRNHPPVGPK